MPEQVEVKLLADSMLGRMAKWLRIMGHDCLYDGSWDDLQLARIARAENRILLTRDRELARRRGIRCLLVGYEALEDQLHQAVEELGLRIDRPFSRCPVCNELLEDVPKNQVRGQVPPYVFQTQDRFRLCGTCNRVYWRGTHWEHMRAVLAKQDNSFVLADGCEYNSA